MTVKKVAKAPAKAVKAAKNPAVARKKAETPVRRPAKVSQPVLRKSAAISTPAASPAPPSSPRIRRGASTPAKPRDPQRVQGQLERKVRADLRGAEKMSPAFDSLAQLAFTLAQQLDDGAGMATAAISKELRATLNQLVGGSDDVDAELKLFVAHVSAEMGDPTTT